jgi:uncharacterized protein YjbI with pentapeptide repeats
MTEQPATTSACPHPEAVGTRWGDPISAERQAELQGYLDRWAAEVDHGERKGPFDKQKGDEHGVSLAGADVSWLAEQSERDASGFVPNLHLEGAYLFKAHLEGAYLIAAHLERAGLIGAHLERAIVVGAHLEGAYIFKADLEGANLREAHLKWAHLNTAHLEGADLRLAHLEGADLSMAHLEGADLRHAWMDKATALNNAALDRVSLDQLSFDGANLAVVDWSEVEKLGDEVRARTRKDDEGERKRRDVRQNDYGAAVRAHLQLAAAMRSQGMGEQGDRFGYRALVLQCKGYVYRFPGKLGNWLFSRVLDLISGYGYRPFRSFITYAVVILAFAATYFALGGANGQVLSWNEALVISMTAFHGRGFFQTTFQVGDPQAAVAAVEAFFGLLIEITLIATFTQRFFAR